MPKTKPTNKRRPASKPKSAPGAEKPNVKAAGAGSKPSPASMYVRGDEFIVAINDELAADIILVLQASGASLEDLVGSKVREALSQAFADLRKTAAGVRRHSTPLSAQWSEAQEKLDLFQQNIVRMAFDAYRAEHSSPAAIRHEAKQTPVLAEVV